jgi:hypothetical protein
MMIDSPGPDGGHYDFDRFLEFAKDPPQVKRERRDGRDCIRLDLTSVSTKGLVQELTQWHDVDRNYLIWKKSLTYKGSSDRFDSEILEFAEPAPGIFVPLKCRRQGSNGSGQTSLEIVTLSNVQVNKPIPKSIFQLSRIPAGTILNDRIQGTRYPIDENWQPIGPGSPLLMTPVPAQSEGPEGDYRSQSSSESVPLSRWVMSASLLVLVAACAGLLYRQYRSQKHLQPPT